MENWKVEDGITYLYQVVADADLVTAASEIETVKKQAGLLIAKHFGNAHYSYADSLKKIQQTKGVNLLNCAETIAQIMARFDFTKDVKEDILRDLDQIAASDLQVTDSEKDTIGFIKKALLTVKMPLSW